MTLVRNNLIAKEVKRSMEEAEYLHARVNISGSELDVVNYYCPDDKMLDLDSIQVRDSGFLIAGDFNSQSQSWGYNTMDKRGEEIEAWQDEHHLIIANDPLDTPTFILDVGTQQQHLTWHSVQKMCTKD